jgi:sugar lactone lactonase YvrE
MRTLFSGLGTLEYLRPDGTGGMLLSNSSNNAIERITRSGIKTTVVPNVNGPGAMAIRGGQLYFNTGDALVGGTGNPNGTIDRVDLTTYHRDTYSSGLVMPNGLTFSRAGDAYVTRDIGADAQVVKVPASTPNQPNRHWANLGDTNGVRADPTQTWLYVSTTFNQAADVYRIRLANPADIELVASLANTGNALPKGLDDMTEDKSGVLYIAANGSGEVLRLDPSTGQSCALASGLQNPSAVEFGAGPGWRRDHLFVSGFDGTIRELTPPAS